MHILWLYTGDDGRSHFADLDAPLTVVDGSGISERFTATGVRLLEAPEGDARDFHPAPRRQFNVMLSGVVELECGDGSKRRLGPGTILLADDVSGQGHITRTIEGPRRVVQVHLGDGIDPRAWLRS